MSKQLIEHITITKSEQTNLIDISDNYEHHTYLTLTKKDLVRMMLLSNQLKEGETRKIQKD